MPDFHQKIDQLRDTLVGVVPQPEGQIAQITYALIYKFMNDFDAESVALGGRRAYFAEDFEKYAWHHLMRPQLDARAREAGQRGSVQPDVRRARPKQQAKQRRA